jgi:hypothetical protein
VWNTPRSLLRVLGAFFFSWCAFAPFLVLDTLWFARNIFGGCKKQCCVCFFDRICEGSDENSVAYQEGVRMSLYNSASFSGVSLLFSLLLPFLIRPPVGVKVGVFYYAIFFTFYGSRQCGC